MREDDGANAEEERASRKARPIFIPRPERMDFEGSKWASRRVGDYLLLAGFTSLPPPRSIVGAPDHRLLFSRRGTGGESDLDRGYSFVALDFSFLHPFFFVPFYLQFPMFLFYSG